MRKRYIDPKQATSVSTESMGTETMIDNRPVLSLEEEIVILQEACDLHNQVQAGLDEAVRVEDVSNNILDISDTVEGVSELTPQQAALIDTAAEMAVAGTDTNPDVVIPSMECYIGTKLSVEGFRETAANVWRQIREFVEQLIEQIKQALKNFFSALPRQLQRIKMLRQLVAAKKKDGTKEPKAREVAVVVGANALSYPGYLVKDARELKTGLKDLNKLGDWVFGQYTQSVKVQGAIIAEELRGFEPAKASETLESAAKRLAAANFRSVISGVPSNGYMGCFEIKMKRMPDSKKVGDLSAAQTLNALRHTYVSLGTSKVPGTHSFTVKNVIATPTLIEVDEILNSVEALVKAMSSFEVSSSYKGMQDTKQAITAAGNTAEATWTRAENNVTGSEASFAMDVMKSLMNFNTTYARWMSSLPGEFIKRGTDAVRATLNVCEKTVALY